MGKAVGGTLPLAIGVAISPVPVIAVISMLLSPRATGTGVGFLVGWVVGVALALARREWRGRPRPGHLEGLPSWMSAIESMTPVRATGLGAGESAVGVAGFVVVASSTVAVPVIGYVVARDRVSGPLDDLRDWLTDNNATVMAVLLLVIGAVILGQGLAGL